MSFRPIKSQVIGQNDVFKVLLRAQKAGHSHAFALFGPSGIGKRTLAVRAAREILGDAMARPGKHRHFHYVVPIEKTQGAGGRISADAIRALRLPFSTMVPEGQQSVLILEDAHTMTHQAQNALLKFLEEPRARTTIFLTARRRDQFLGTILSRVVAFDIPRVKDENIVTALVAVGADRGKALQIAKRAEGRPGIAFRLLEDAEYKARAIVADQLFETFAAGSLAKSFGDIGKIARSASKTDIAEYLESWMVSARHCLHEAAGIEAAKISEPVYPHTGLHTANDWAGILDVLLEAEAALTHNVQKSLVLERIATHITPSI
ncbi:MAG: AAA family ATPase [bacterium]|nr:AAA family ATPase [bacterium]MDA1024525.1 AAA family ATPase [bacterium]